MRKMQFCGVAIVIAFILSLSRTAADQSSTTLSVPAVAQASISAAIDQDNPGYSAKAEASGFEATICWSVGGKAS